MKKLNELQSYLTRLRGLMLTLIILCSIGSGNMWGAEGDTYDFAQTLSQSLNYQYTIRNVTVAEQSYSVKTVKVTVVYDKNAEGATVSVKVGGVTFGKAQTIKSKGTKVFTYEGASAVKGEVVVSSVNNCGWGWNKGTFQITNVQLTEGPDESCTANPTIGTAQLKEPFSLSSVGVTVTGSNVGSPNCSWTDYGFVWGTSANPTTSNNQVQVGTSGSATTWDGTLTGSFKVGTTYYYRAYGKNGKAGAGVQYGSDKTFIPRSVTLNDSWNPVLDKYDIYTTVYTASGTPAAKPKDPTKSGYTFAGWYKEPGLTNAVNWSDNITENKTYYAKWTGNQYTITLDNQGATSAGTKSISVTYGANTNLSSTPAITVPTKNGYTFGGYYTETDGGGSQIIDATGSVIADANDDVSKIYTDKYKQWLHSGNITLYAKWTINNYTVSWSVDGADWKGAEHGSPSTSVTYNSKPSTIPTAPNGDEVCGGKVFVGWTNAAINSPTDERPAILFTSQSGAPEITENTTFYAVFADVVPSAGWEKLTSISASNIGDEVVFVYDGTAKYEMTGVASYLGTATSRTTIPDDITGTFTMTIEQGYNNTGYSFKNGTNYIRHNADKKIELSNIKDALSSWTASGTSGNFKLNNNSNTSYNLQFNSGYPRWTDYDSNQSAFQIYKRAAGASNSNYRTLCSTPDPSLSVSPASLSGLTYVQGSGPSSKQTFTVSGSDLTANVTVTAPTNFEVSKDGSSYAASQTITASGTLSATTIYVRLKSGLSVNNYSGDIAVESTGATSKTVSLSGSVTAPAYTVVWTINPAAGGTLSTTSGTSTTVTPNSAYTYGSPEYTVTSGSATVSQNTNTFTATPTSDCTISINMVEKPKFTVTLMDDGDTRTQDSYGASVTLPARAGCAGYTFAGWTKTWVAPQSSWTTTAPTIIPEGSYTPAEDENLYPVYTKEEGGVPVETKTQTFQYDTWVNGGSSTDKSANSYRLFHDGGYVESASDVDFSKLSKVIVYGGTFGGDSYDRISIKKEDGTVWKNATVSGSSQTGKNEITGGASLTGSAKLRVYSTCGSTSGSGSGVRISKVEVYTMEGGSTTYYISVPGCCTQPVKQLAIAADQTELVRSGAVNFTLTGGNGKDITWSCRDERDANCDDLLKSTSNSGATLTISSPVAATKTYTVKAVQPEDDDDAEVVCGKTVTMDITVKAQWTINFQTTDDGSLSTYSTETVTDGDTYTFPDLSDDYICAENYSFAGWKADNTNGAPEYAAGSSAKASADKTWYAVWMYSTGTTTITRDKYERMTSGQSIAANDVVVVAYVDGEVALKQMTEADEAGAPIAVDFSADKSYLTFAPGTAVMQLKALWHDDADNDLDGWLLQDNSADFRLTYSGEKGGTLYYTNESGWFWDITITAQNNAIIEDTETGYDYSLKYNTSRNVFAFYSSGQKIVQLYRKNGTISIDVPSTPTYYVNNEHCTNGATIRANGGQWITSAKDQKVRITVPVTAKNFATSGKQITGSSDNAHFAVSVASHTIPGDKSESAPINVTIEYTPAEANVIETANITLTTGAGADDATRVIEVNGRSLPDEFVIVTQKEGKWQALPANMFNGTGTYSPMEVTPNGGITAIPAAPYTTIYSAREVASGRYESAGTCMRLVGNNNKCLWANNSSNGTGIQNFAALGNTNGAQYEWLLSTADGEQYTIANPAHPDYATGRQLGIYTLKYGLYKTTDIFYLLPVGCSSQPGNLQITPRRVDAMFSWETNAASVTIDLWTNEAMSAGHKQAVVTSVPYQFTGLTENTDYWYKITPGSDDDCAVTGTFSTTGPTIDVVEWGENSATIFVDKDEAVDPQIIIAGEVEHGQGGAVAKDIFFSKYFEAQEKAKLLAIYNGTGNAISLADITIVQRANATALSLAKYGKTPGFIQPGEEIILYYPSSVSAIMDCAEAEKSFGTWNDVSKETGSSNLDFGGKGTIRMFRGSKCIDIIGAMASDATAGDMNSASVKPIDGPTKPSFGDDQGFVTDAGDNYSTDAEENDYELSTNRCLLIRKPHVVSGDSAVLNNFGDFKTLGTYTGVDSKTHKGEWAGLQIPNGPVGDQYHYTCEGFKDVGVFDYNKYYREYTQIGNDKYLSDFTRAADGTYTLPIAYMRQYACLNLKFQLTEHNNKTNVLTEQTVQVPIVVKDARNSNDTLFNNIIKADEAPHTPMVPQSIERCKTCNVVVLSTGTLTKATDGATDDVAEVRDVKVYPGGKLIVPEGTHYVINSLSLRRQEDEIASAKIDAGLSSDPSDVSNKGLYIRESNGVYLDVRIDPSNWHYFTLPYDCRVGDIRFSDGTPAKVNNDYLISWYDGAYRAEHKDGGWTDITEEDYVLKKGLGYIVALPGEGLIKRELRFPMANEVISAELANKEVGGLYAYGGDKTDEKLRPNHKGWNMIGNPYLYDYTTDIVKSPLATGELKHDPSSPWNGQWVRTSSSARYIVEPIDNGWTGYRQTTISNLKPFTSYFIQIGTTTDGTDNPETERNITFTKTSKASIARRNMPAAEAEEPMYPVWYGIEMTAPNAEKDNTTLLISDEFTDGYDMMDDLIKMRGSYYQYYPYPVLASRNNEGEMAFNALPDSSASVIGVPLNYYAAQAGTYTIRTDSRFDLEEVKSAMLYDATTNQYNDLLAGDYSFTTAKGDNTNRFKLFVRVERKKAPDVATGTDNILENGKLSLIAIDRTLVLSGLDEAADIYVYDMSGKLIKGERNAGEGVWRANVSAQGVYFVRVNSQSGQQTLRTIVK